MVAMGQAIKRDNASIFFTVVGVLIMCAAFSLRLSTSISSILIPLSCVILLFFARVPVWRNIRHNPVCSLAILLVLTYIIGLFYSTATWHLRINSLKHYLPLLYFPFLMVLFQKNNQWSLRVSYALVFGSCFYLLLCVIYSYHILPLAKLLHRNHMSGDMYLYNRCPFLLAISTYLAAEFVLFNKGKLKIQLLFLIMCCFMIWALLFVSTVRSDYVVLAVAMIVFIVQHVRKRFLIPAALGFIIVGFIVFQSSPHMRHGLTRIKHSLVKYEKGNPVTSSGLRLLFAHNGINLWRHRPILGYGTGAFQKEYITLHSYGADSMIATAKDPLDQPHNQFVYTMVEVGSVGLILLLAMLGSAFFYSFKLPELNRKLSQAVVITFAVFSLFTSSFFYHVSSYSFSLLLALCFFPLLAENKRDP
jgi:O-antigen ligase